MERFTLVFVHTQDYPDRKKLNLDAVPDTARLVTVQFKISKQKN